MQVKLVVKILSLVAGTLITMSATDKLMRNDISTMQIDQQTLENGSQTTLYMVIYGNVFWKTVSPGAAATELPLLH